MSGPELGRRPCSWARKARGPIIQLSPLEPVSTRADPGPSGRWRLGRMRSETGPGGGADRFCEYTDFQGRKPKWSSQLPALWAKTCCTLDSPFPPPSPSSGIPSLSDDLLFSLSSTPFRSSQPRVPHIGPGSCFLFSEIREKSSLVPMASLIRHSSFPPISRFREL